jgi:hypothetical protein
VKKFWSVLFGGRKHGMTRAVRCPFHEERTPSCSLDELAGTFLCFGCGRKGTFTEVIDRHYSGNVRVGVDTATSFRVEKA